jgi:hypothetical protein
MKRLLLIAPLALAACGSPPDASQCSADDPLLTCAPDVSAVCTGDATALAVEDPKACGDDLTLGSDAPAGGYAVGETVVTFTAMGDGVDESCTTTVTIIDDQEPTIDCPQDETVVRTDPNESVSAPEATATDDCSGAVTVTTDPLDLPNGATDVAFTATDEACNIARCTATVTVIDLFAVTGFRIINATLNGSAETEITLAWDRTDAADATGYRIERAADAAGPWTALDTVGVATELYTDTMPATVAYYRIVTVADALDGGITDPQRALAIADDLYDIRNQPVTGIPFDTTLYGVVRYPTDLSEGPFPLILVLHGNHGNCRSTPDSDNDFCSTTQDHDCSSAGDFTTPNAEGYIYFLETLASQGYIAVSLSGNAVNCRDDYIIERSHLIIEHLRRWVDWNVNSGGPFGATFVGRVDVDRVGLVGHSRGGDAVSHVPTELATDTVPGATVESVFAIAPTDFHDVVIPGTSFAVLLPSCDGDVFDLQGMDHYDRSIPLDDGERRAQVFFIGANHNFFNTEWKLSDNGGGFSCNPSAEVGKQAQQGMLEATLGAWFAGTLHDQPLEPFIRAEGDTPTAMDAHAGLDLDLRWSYSSDDRLLVDDFEGTNTPDVNDLGGTNTFTGGWHDLTTQCFENDCDSRFDHKKGGMKLLWEEPNTPVATWQLGDHDATAHTYFSGRVVSRRSSLNTYLEVQDFSIRLYDADCNVAELVLSDVKTLYHLYPTNYSREILQTARIRLDDLLAINPDLDLTSLDVFELEMNVLDRSGSVIVTDLEFAE